MLGLKIEELKLGNSYRFWKKEFHRIKSRLIKILNGKILTIEHIGSTSVKDLTAKPIIDIAIGIKIYEDGFECISILENNGFIYKGEYGIKGRHYFVNQGDIIKYHIHMLCIDSKEYKNHILFRNLLRENKKIKDEYCKLKIEFLRKGYSREKYVEEKEKYVSKIIQKINNV